MNNVSWVFLASAAESGGEMTVWSVLAESSGMVLVVLIALVLASLVSWFVIGFKALQVRRAITESRKFIEVFWASKRLENIYDEAKALQHAPVSRVFQAGFIELRKVKGQKSEGSLGEMGGISNIERALRRAQLAEVSRLEQHVSFLATVGSTSPFVGLFGTVWGIMLAFMNLATANEGAAMGIDVVAGPIAEALIATAIGLMAAIPAVIAYNAFTAKIGTLAVEMENFSSDFLNIVKRHFF